MRATHYRKSLLGSSAIMATTAVLMMQATPARADCSAANGITCLLTSTGSVGTAAPSSGAPANGHGNNGGGGGKGGDWTIYIDGFNWVEDAANKLSPLSMLSYGGAGAQGSDATAGLDGKNGGSGGNGGDGGVITLTTLSNMSGSSTLATGMSLFTIGGAAGAGPLATLGWIPPMALVAPAAMGGR